MPTSPPPPEPPPADLPEPILPSLPAPPPEKLGSWLVLTAALALGLFFLALAIGILPTPVDGPAWGGVLVKLFIGLTFGAIIVGCGAAVVKEARKLLSRSRGPRPAPASRLGAAAEPLWSTVVGELEGLVPPVGFQAAPADPSARSLPAVLAGLCGGCGWQDPATPRRPHCPGCGRPSDLGIWVGEPRPWASTLVGLLLGGGLTALGLFVAIGPYFDGERRAWALVAFAALGVLLALVGAVLLGGALLLTWKDLIGPRRYQFHAHEPRPPGTAYIAARAQLAGGRLIEADGVNCTTSTLDGAGGVTASPSPAQTELARLLVLLHRHGLVSIWRQTTRSWTRGPDRAEEAEQRLVRRLYLTRCPPRLGVYLPEAVAVAMGLLHPRIDEDEDDPTTAGSLWQRVESSPELMALLAAPAPPPFRTAADLLADDDGRVRALAQELAAAG